MKTGLMANQKGGCFSVCACVCVCACMCAYLHAYTKEFWRNWYTVCDCYVVTFVWSNKPEAKKGKEL